MSIGFVVGMLVLCGVLGLKRLAMFFAVIF